MSLAFLGKFWNQRLNGLKDLEEVFWSNRSDQPAMLDKLKLLTLWKYEEGKFDVIDGNHKIALFLKHGFKSDYAE